MHTRPPTFDSCSELVPGGARPASAAIEIAQAIPRVECATFASHRQCDTCEIPERSRIGVEPVGLREGLRGLAELIALLLELSFEEPGSRQLCRGTRCAPADAFEGGLHPFVIAHARVETRLAFVDIPGGVSSLADLSEDGEGLARTAAGGLNAGEEHAMGRRRFVGKEGLGKHARGVEVASTKCPLGATPDDARGLVIAVRQELVDFAHHGVVR